MRSEQEILDLILNTAQADERIRAVVMNGSRVNPNAPRDPFQDYDVIYWEALFSMGELFRFTAQAVAQHLGYTYPTGDDQRVSNYLKHIYHLPATAQEIF